MKQQPFQHAPAASESVDRPGPAGTVTPETLVRVLTKAALIVSYPPRRVEAMNRPAEALFGYRAADLVGCETRALHVDEPAYMAFDKARLEAARRGGPYVLHGWMRHRDGTVLPVELLPTPIQWTGPDQLILVMIDVVRDAPWARLYPIMRSLTEREREIMRATLLGLSAKEAARELGISPRTVESYRARLMRKFDVASTGALVARFLTPIPVV